MPENKKDKSILEQEQKSWAETPRIRPDWVPIKHGEHVLPQNEQKSNNNLTDDQVLQSRTENVILGSSAKPIGGRKDTGHGQSDEPSGRKQNLPSNFTRIG